MHQVAVEDMVMNTIDMASAFMKHAHSWGEQKKSRKENYILLCPSILIGLKQTKVESG